MIEVYTDGSCLGNPGTGGWAFLILREGENINHFGYQQNTTNNQMELTAAINALEFIKENLDKPWYWYWLSRNPNITFEFIEKNLDKNWDWVELSKNPIITIDIVKNKSSEGFRSLSS